MSLQDHQVFTNGAELAAHYAQVKKKLMNLKKVEQTPEPVEVPVSTVEEVKGPRIVIPAHLVEDYKRSMSALQDRPSSSTKMKTIVKEVADKHNFTYDEMFVRRRKAALSAARHEAFYRLRHELKLSFPRIGNFFYMDHTSVLHGVQKMEAKLEKEKASG
jgi:chromosomal replication initiation ATPase DnaA